ncbi:MAG: shikimate dehydrogenase [Dokdonella sp.]
MTRTPSHFAVFGRPIAHSRSPHIHAAFARQFGIDIDYRRIEAGRDDFAKQLSVFGDAGGRGANLTLPLKEIASSACSLVSPRARRAGSINTLTRSDDGWLGDSTDGIGLVADLCQRHQLDLRDARVLIIGAGGAARAAAAVLIDAEIAELVVANRDIARAQKLCAEIDPRGRSIACDFDALHGRDSVDLLINATSAGHSGQVPGLPTTIVGKTTIAYDLSYGAAAQPFLSWAVTADSARQIDGLGMLVEQAAASFAIWHAVQPATAPVYDALRAEVGFFA